MQMITTEWLEEEAYLPLMLQLAVVDSDAVMAVSSRP